VLHKPKKTYKREVAIALIVWLAYIVEVKDVSVVEVLVWPIFAFLGAAFGFDSYSKQLQQTPVEPIDRGRSKRSSEYPVGENEHPDGRDYEK
jgi:hypothetical protein